MDGAIDAPSREAALDMLWEQGLFPIEVVGAEPIPAEAQQVEEKGKEKKKPVITGRRKKVTTKQIFLFSQKLNTLIRSKVDLLSSLRIVYEQTDHLVMKEMVLKMHNATKEGKVFSESLAEYPNLFSPLYVNIVKAGEVSGALDAALEQICDFMARDESLKSKIAVAFAYPSILLAVGLGSVFVLINFVVPRLSSMFDSLGPDLPLLTKIVLKISELSNESWFIVVGILGVAALALFMKKGGDFFKKTFGKIKRKIPVVRRIVKNQELAFFSRSMGLLLKSGVTLLKSFSTTIPGIDDPAFRAELEGALRKVAAGQSFYQSIDGIKGLPSFYSKMLAVGEQSGRLSEMFEELAQSYTQQIEGDISLLSALLEPLLILFLGLIMGTIVVSILIPMFEITQMVQ